MIHRRKESGVPMFSQSSRTRFDLDLNKMIILLTDDCIYTWKSSTNGT